MGFNPRANEQFALQEPNQVTTKNVSQLRRFGAVAIIPRLETNNQLSIIEHVWRRAVSGRIARRAFADHYAV